MRRPRCGLAVTSVNRSVVSGICAASMSLQRWSMTRAPEKGRIRCDAMPARRDRYAEDGARWPAAGGSRRMRAGPEDVSGGAASRGSGISSRTFRARNGIFVHHPDGEKDGVELAALRSVDLRRQKASDSVDGKASTLGFPRTGKGRLCSVLCNRAQRRHWHPRPGADRLRRSGGDEDGDGIRAERGQLCLLWASAEYLKETRAKRRRNAGRRASSS